jgi:hypothetical protein
MTFEPPLAKATALSECLFKCGSVVFKEIVPNNGCPILGHNFQRPGVPAFEFVDIHFEWHPIFNDALRGAGNDKVGFVFYLISSLLYGR